MKAFVEAFTKGALNNLDKLMLCGNLIGEEDRKEFALSMRTLKTQVCICDCYD